MVTLKFFHGGKFKKVGEKLVYVGKKIRTVRVDPDELCWWDLVDMAKKCGGYTDIKGIHYLMPGMGFDSGLRRVYNDDECRELGILAMKERCVDLFVEHGHGVGDDHGPTLNSVQQPAIVETERPQKLAPRRAPATGYQLALRRSPRKQILASPLTPSVECGTSAAVDPTPQISQPINTKQPKEKMPKYSSPLPNPTQSTKKLPEVIIEGTQKCTNRNKTTPVTAINTPTSHEAAGCSSQLNTPYITTNLVPVDHEWEDPRPNSPINVNDLIPYYTDSEEERDPEYEPSTDSSEEGDTNEDGFVVEEPEHGLLEEDIDEENDADVETSDDEFVAAKERVRGCNNRLIQIAQQLQRDASEGKLGSQLRKEAVVGERRAASNNEDGFVSEYEDSGDEIHTPPASDEEETAEERGVKRSLMVNLDCDFSVFKWQVGQRFSSRDDFKKAVTKYAVFQGRNVYFKVSNRNRQQRVGVRCCVRCPFELYASWHSRKGAFVVKTVREEHTCTRDMKKNRQLKSSWLAEQLLDVFKARPHWPAKEMQETVRRGYKVLISLDFAYKVKQYAHGMLHGSMKDHYRKLGRYLEALKKASPGSHMQLIAIQKDGMPAQTFQRLFISFEGLLRGWKQGCRKIICVDACFLKTFLGGQLLSAVGRDGNDQMYPIAWAIVEGENNFSWEWFFEQLQLCLNLGEGADLVIVSDEHQSILHGVASVLPLAEHRHCARHVFAHWHKNFRGDEMKLAFWCCVKAYNEEDYEDALQDLATKNQDAATAFNSYNPGVFCRSFMSTIVKSDAVTNNMAETFNGYIVHARTKHLINMLEDIRAALMKRLFVKRNEMEKWTSDISPRILVKVQKEKEQAAMCEVIPSTSTLFQVNYILDSLTVDIARKTCTCRRWDMCGYPCSHACAALFFCGIQPEEYVDECYKSECYMKAYSVSIPPIEGERHWPRSDLTLDPPPIKIGPGRPRKNRKKDPFEDPKRPGKLTRHGMEMTCTLCKSKGHNKRGCHDKGTIVPEQPPVKRPRGRPRSDGQPPATAATSQPRHHATTAEPTRLGRGGRVIRGGRGSRGGGNGRGSNEGGGRGRGGSESGRGRGSNVSGGSVRGRGAGTGRGRGRGGMPQGFGVIITQDGSAYSNVVGGSGPRCVTDTVITTTFRTNSSQASTSRKP